jgi:hypothetical protein
MTCVVVLAFTFLETRESFNFESIMTVNEGKLLFVSYALLNVTDDKRMVFNWLAFKSILNVKIVLVMLT